MALFDLYPTFNILDPYNPGQGPRYTGKEGEIKHHVRHGRFGRGQYLHWTHVLVVTDLTLDIRSAYDSQLGTFTPSNADTVYIKDYPLKDQCTAFLVVFTQIVSRGQASQYRRCYLDRVRPRIGDCNRCFQWKGALIPIPWQYCIDPATNIRTALAIPSRLHATFLNPTCGCINGKSIELNYNANPAFATPQVYSWVGTLPASVCGHKVDLNFQFYFDGFFNYLVDIHLIGGGPCVVNNGYADRPIGGTLGTNTCCPVHWTFLIGFSLSTCGCGALATTQVLITE